MLKIEVTPLSFVSCMAVMSFVSGMLSMVHLFVLMCLFTQMTEHMGS